MKHGDKAAWQVKALTEGFNECRYQYVQLKGSYSFQKALSEAYWVCVGSYHPDYPYVNEQPMNAVKAEVKAVMSEAQALDYACDHGVRVSTDSQRARVISFWVDDRISAHKVSRFKGTREWTIDGGMVNYSRGEAIRDCVNRILAARLVREL
jgi:hypothetical protein